MIGQDTSSQAEFLVDTDSEGRRLDLFLAEKLGDISRSRIQQAIRSGLVTRNGKETTSSKALTTGDRITWKPPTPLHTEAAEAEDLPLCVLYEDDDLIAVNKAAGMVVHPGAGNSSGTLVSALLHYGARLSNLGGMSRPGIVHRLDKETSGVMIIAKNDSAHAALSAAFAGREIQKTYLALVEKSPPRTAGTINAAIGRHPVFRKKMTVSEKGRSAVTEFRVRGQTPEGLYLIECRPLTGRTHQIRVHLKHLGCPVAGDPLYGRRGNFERHLLHAWKLSFKHPRNGKRLCLEADPPPLFQTAAGKMRRTQIEKRL